jgi:hypothetical protein
MNTKRWIQASVMVVVVMWVVESVVHGLMLSDLYKQTVSVWRPMGEMEKLMPLMWLGYALFAPFFVFLYAKGMEPKKEAFGQGLRFGLIFGVGLSAMSNLVWYVILPIPTVLAFYWFLDGIAVYAIAGVTVALVYRPEKTKAKRR